jgi:hypothetical protein
MTTESLSSLFFNAISRPRVFSIPAFTPNDKTNILSRSDVSIKPTSHLLSRFLQAKMASRNDTNRVSSLFLCDTPFAFLMSQTKLTKEKSHIKTPKVIREEN